MQLHYFALFDFQGALRPLVLWPVSNHWLLRHIVQRGTPPSCATRQPRPLLALPLGPVGRPAPAALKRALGALQRPGRDPHSFPRPHSNRTPHARHSNRLWPAYEQVSPRAKHQQSGPPLMHGIDFACADYELDLAVLAAYV
jgi:hypothetical protein